MIDIDGFSLPPEVESANVGRLAIKNASEQVVERLVTAIALGAFLPGQKFPPEREFAERLGVSRATLRAAMHDLARQGFVTIRRGRSGGTMISATWRNDSPELIRRALEPRWQALDAVLDFGRELNGLVAELAAVRRRRGDISEIRRWVKAYAAAGERDEMRAADHALHAAIAAATHNLYFVQVIGQIRAQLSMGTDAFPFSDSIREQAIDEHGTMLAAIEMREAGTARTVATKHFVDLIESPLRKLYRRVHRREHR